MKRFLFILMAALMCGPAFGDLVAASGQNELRLMHQPCMHGGILGQLKEEYRPLFKKAQAFLGGKLFYACWIDTGDGAYFVVFEDGDAHAYPVSGFLDVPGV